VTKARMVKKNFSRNPDYYHKNAETQRYAASSLAEIIQQQTTGKVEKILEIGCGTGFLTEKLLSLFPHAEFTITDISNSMLQFCEQQTRALRSKKKIVADFAVNDISKSCPEENFDLIVSSLAFQWIDDLETTMHQIRNKLSKNGTVIFSTLSQGTFSSAKRFFNDFNVPFPGPQLLTSEQIKSACHQFANVDLVEELQVEEFDSMLMFLRHIQRTGAGNASGHLISTRDLKKILSQYKLKIQAEYNIVYMVAK
jgi:malonyl-CoA O-methyltransferase